MKKSEALQQWAALEPDQNPLEAMTPIAYKSTGSRYGACGIRIDGNPDFVNAVLSRLKPLLDGENQVTRLELARSEVKPTEIHGETRTFGNADRGAEVCYIRLHMRGSEGAMMMGLMQQNVEATDRFAATSRYAK